MSADGAAPRWTNMDGQIHFAGERDCCSILGRDCPRCGGFVHVMPIYGGLMDACETCDAAAFNDPPAPEHDECGFSPPGCFGDLRAHDEIRDAAAKIVRMMSPAGDIVKVEIEKATAASESTVTIANVWRGTAEMPVPSAVQRVLEAEREKLRQAPITAVMRIEDPTLLAATRAGYADLQATLQETLDWMNIRAIAAAGLAELHALAMSGEPATGSLTQSDLQRLRARIDEWLPGQSPRTLDDMRNGNEVQRLQREVDRLRALLGGR